LESETRAAVRTMEGRPLAGESVDDEPALGVPQAKFTTVDVPFGVPWAYDGHFRVKVRNRMDGDGVHFLEPPMVILFGWLGSTLAELDILAAKHEEKGHSTVCVAFPPPLIMPWRLGTSPEVRNTLASLLASLADFLDTEPLVRRWAHVGERSYVLHAFSAGALAVLHVASPELYRGPKNAEAFLRSDDEARNNLKTLPKASAGSVAKLRERVAGVIFDSCPVSDSPWSGIPGSYYVTSFVCKAYGVLLGTLLYLVLLLYDAVCLVHPIKILFGRRPRWVSHWPHFSTFSFGVPVPELYLYNREDKFLDYPNLREMLDARDARRVAAGARTVKRKCFLKSKHCRHATLNAREYWDEVAAFMRRAKVWWAINRD